MKTALILVDIQNDYFPGGKMELNNMDQAALNANTLLQHFRKIQLPIFHIQHIAKRPDAHFFISGTHGAEIHTLLKPELNQNEILITKHYPNAFRETNLHTELKTRAIENLMICGAMSHMCIDTSTRAAFDLGYASIVIADACATKNLSFDGADIPATQVHAAYMAGLQGIFAKVMMLSDWKSEQAASFNAQT